MLFENFLTLKWEFSLLLGLQSRIIFTAGYGSCLKHILVEIFDARTGAVYVKQQLSTNPLK